MLERYDPYGSELTFASPRSRGPVRPGQRLSTRRRVRPENEGNLAPVTTGLIPAQRMVLPCSVESFKNSFAG